MMNMYIASSHVETSLLRSIYSVFIPYSLLFSEAWCVILTVIMNMVHWTFSQISLAIV